MLIAGRKTDYELLHNVSLTKEDSNLLLSACQVELETDVF